MRTLKLFSAAILGLAIVSCSNEPKDKHLVRDYSAIDTTGFYRTFDDVNAQPCNELHSMLVIKDGKIVYEEYAPGHTADELHILWSATKTFTATGIGFAVQDGLLTVDDKVISFFDKSELPEEPSEYLKQLTVKNLLTMSGGFAEDAIHRLGALGDTSWVKVVLNCDYIFEPGQKFSYNSMESYLLSAIVSKVTGKTLAGYLKEKLFDPLGIERFIYLQSPEGYNCGGWGLFLTSESLAKMGQFFLNRGSWNGKQLLNESWFDEAMRPQVMQWQQSSEWDPAEAEQYKDNDWASGYGYQMWCCTHGACRLDGAWGQLVVIIPEKNAAVVFTGHNSLSEQLVRSVWNYVLPAL